MINKDKKNVDPDPLSILGGIMQALGLVEKIKRLVKIDKSKSMKKHKRIDKLVEQLEDKLDDARSGFRLIRSAISENSRGLPSDTAGFMIESNELPVHQRGLNIVLNSIQGITKNAYELESITESITAETERFYRISGSGRKVLGKIKNAISDDKKYCDAENIESPLEEALDEIDKYLSQCTKILRERDLWISG